MSEGKHTPGPWRAVGREVWAGLEIVARACNPATDVVAGAMARPIKDLIADARLIAAAPDMAMAAQPLADLVEHYSGSDSDLISVSVGELRALRAALSKATGSDQ